MKRILSLILSTALLLSVFSVCFVSSVSAVTVSTELINNAHADLDLINPIANAQHTQESNENLPSLSVFDMANVKDVAALIARCMANNVLPMFKVNTKAEADALLAGMTTSGCCDANAYSADASVLAYIRSKTNYIRTGLDLTAEFAASKTSLTSAEANTYRNKVRSAPATFCVINVKNASRELVYALQSLSVAVWVEVTSATATDAYNINVIRAVTSGANGIISNSSNAAANIINSTFAENTMSHTPLIIGHKGNPSQAPENSMLSFKKAYENGADVLEIDLRFTKDGKVIVFHDENLAALTTSTSTTAVTALTYEEIKKYYLLDSYGNATGEKIPLLSDVLAEYKGKDINIFLEFKAGSVDDVKKALDIVKEYGMEGQMSVIDFSATRLTASQANIPGMSTGLLYTYNGINLANNTKEALALLYEGILAAQKINSTVNPSFGAVTPSGTYYTQAAMDRGMTVWPWTTSIAKNDRTPMDQGFLCGSDGITTDDPQWSKSMIKYLDATDVSVAINGTYTGNVATAHTYGRTSTKLGTSSLVYSVISGSEYVEITNSGIKGKAEGIATVVFGYKTKTTAGTEYVVYSQPVEIVVGDAVKFEVVDHAAVGKTAVDASGKAPLESGTTGFIFGDVLTDGKANTSIDVDGGWYTFMTHWNCTSNVGSVTIDLGAKYNLSKIDLHLANANKTYYGSTLDALQPEYIKAYYYSEEKEDYVEIGSFTLKDTLDTVYWASLATTETTQFIKIEVKVNADCKYALMDEIAVFGTEYVEPKPEPKPETEKVDHIAVGKTAVDSSGKIPLGSVEPSRAGFAFDNVLTDGVISNYIDVHNKKWFTYMSAHNATSGTGESTIDLEKLYDLSAIKLHLANGILTYGNVTCNAPCPISIEAFTSTDGKEFTSAGTFELNRDNDAGTYWTEIEFTKYITARYVRIQVKINTSVVTYALIDEIAVYGTENTNAIYSVYFDANGGIGEPVGMDNITAGFSIGLPDCPFTAPEGKQFKAWDVNGTEMAAGESITVNEDLTIYAIWEDIPVTTIDRLLGDVDGDGEVGKSDYVMLKRFIFDTVKLDDNAILAADVNQDGDVNKEDYVHLKRFCFDTMPITPEYIKVPAE